MSLGKTCASGSSCVRDTDCTTGTCYGQTCVSCSNNVRDGLETGIDCGGMRLQEPIVEGFFRVTVEAPGELNGELELSTQIIPPTSTYMGCPACPDQQTCAADTDCMSNACESGPCVSCQDGVRNQDETDIDCGGTPCETRCADQLTCV